jgi:hypothetical protein
MAELRLLHRYLWELGVKIDVEHLPPALNLYADRLSCHRREFDSLPQLAGVPESSRIGASEHDWARPCQQRRWYDPLSSTCLWSRAGQPKTASKD